MCLLLKGFTACIIYIHESYYYDGDIIIEENVWPIQNYVPNGFNNIRLGESAKCVHSMWWWLPLIRYHTRGWAIGSYHPRTKPPRTRGWCHSWSHHHTGGRGTHHTWTKHTRINATTMQVLYMHALYRHVPRGGRAIGLGGGNIPGWPDTMPGGGIIPGRGRPGPPLNIPAIKKERMSLASHTSNRTCLIMHILDWSIICCASCSNQFM